MRPTSQRCVWPTSAIHMSKTSTRMNRVASGFVVEGAPDLTGGRCLHAATARFGQISAAPTGVLFPLELATEPGPLMPPSPPRTQRDVSSLDPLQPRPLPPPPNVMSFGLFGPRHLPSTEEPFSGPFPILDSAFRRAPVHDRCFAFGGSEPPRARCRPRSQPQPGVAFCTKRRLSTSAT
jgi:hypothetical protein